ncbi:hypothetical protein TorRG33x02_264300, partial [Trema orientale]
DRTPRFPLSRFSFLISNTFSALKTINPPRNRGEASLNSSLILIYHSLKKSLSSKDPKAE